MWTSRLVHDPQSTRSGLQLQNSRNITPAYHHHHHHHQRSGLSVRRSGASCIFPTDPQIISKILASKSPLNGSAFNQQTRMFCSDTADARQMLCALAECFLPSFPLLCVAALATCIGRLLTMFGSVGTGPGHSLQCRCPRVDLSAQSASFQSRPPPAIMSDAEQSKETSTGRDLSQARPCHRFFTETLAPHLHGQHDVAHLDQW